MEVKDLVTIMLERGQQNLVETLKDVTQKEMAWQPGPDANPIGFVLWHITRSEDRNFQALLQKKPLTWDVDGWGVKLGISAGPGEFGFGYTSEQIAKFPVLSPSLLLEYAQAVRKGTLQYVGTLSSQTLETRILHPAFGEMSVGQLLARVLGHITEHMGQIGYVRGLLKSANK